MENTIINKKERIYYVGEKRFNKKKYNIFMSIINCNFNLCLYSFKY